MKQNALTIDPRPEPVAHARRAIQPWSAREFLLPLASLKLTVTLFAMAIFLVLAGTVAQIDKGVWQVVNEYFRTTWAWIELRIFFPRSWNISGGFYFPGGFLIGLLMGINLLAAHGLRFKVQAKGPRLAAGLATVVLGIGLTWLVIARNGNQPGPDGTGLIGWPTLWHVIRGGLVVIWVATVYALFTLDRGRRVERVLLGAAASLLGILIAWLFYHIDTMPLGASSMRILWQLLQGSVAGLVLLGGCILLFRRRAGIVLLHAGIGLMMANELVVYGLHTESQMSIHEGEAVNYSQDIRQIELAVIDPSYSKDEEKVVAIPQSYLVPGRPIDDKAIPFRVEVVRLLPNASDRRALRGGEPNPATAGTGLHWTVDPLRPGAGTDTSGTVDMPAAYVHLVDKANGKDLGTYLVGLFQSMRGLSEKVTVDGKPYRLTLRYKRLYKPYTIQLIDVRFDKYLGTNMARNYSSDIRLIDPSRHVDREVHIWMNNPLRYEGETFYQSQFQVDPANGTEVTGLQVVANTGWMIPYVACMIVATGLLAHFSIVLLRFLNRRDRMAEGGSASVVEHPRSRKRRRRAGAVAAKRRGLVEQLFPWAVALIAAIWLIGKAVPHASTPDTFDLDAFGQLPVVYEGRVKPIDTVARNSLRIISGRQTFTDQDGKGQPAIRWLLDVISDTPAAGRHKVFRIENLELLGTLHLKQRSGYRFALDEFRQQIDEIDRQARLAHSLKARQLSVFQKKVLELEKKLRLYWRLREAYFFPPLRTDHIEEDLRAAKRRRKDLARYSLPHAIPPAADAPNGTWEPYTYAVVTAWAKRVVGQQPNPATQAMAAMLASYADGDPDAFNREVTKYQTYLATNTPRDLNLNKTRFESFFNHFQPFYYAAVLYVFAFVLAATSWLGWTRPLNRAAFWLIVVTFVVHTFALGARIYISGRPPVTNLYSSAIFLGWGCVVLGLILELLYRLGVGNIIAAVAGFLTLLIAHFLSGDGDTFVVLQAVLDTQFWLATHVTCITFGYSTTFLAGFLGILYIVRGALTPSLTPQLGKEIARMIYGILCFAIFFSFVGTVLGGLWADDSWGRFWGWDPKENGALIIVLWNALVLHARWDGLVRDRGLAVLAVGGNIATSWSWFGVNELGAGLHSYGFTEGVALALLLFVASQLAIMAIGSMPIDRWWSFRRLAAGRVT